MKNFLYSVCLLYFCLLPVSASISVERTTDPEYVINDGFSEVMAEDVLMMKNRISGNPIEPLYEKNNSKVIKCLKNIHSYIDPAIDTDAERYHHNIHLNPSYLDY